jgi:hypothetical protein
MVRFPEKGIWVMARVKRQWCSSRDFELGARPAKIGSVTQLRRNHSASHRALPWPRARGVMGGNSPVHGPGET